jgi:hypothetical protein
MGYDYLPGLSRKKTPRDLDPLPKLLEDWLGRDAAAKEIESRLPPPVSISEGVDQALKQLFTPELALIQQIKRLWPDIAGEALSGYMTPVFIQNGTLAIEVSHPAFMMNFGKQESDLLIAKIDEVVGKGKCVKIRLIPTGRTAGENRRFKKKEPMKHE